MSYIRTVVRSFSLIVGTSPRTASIAAGAFSIIWGTWLILAQPSTRDYFPFIFLIKHFGYLFVGFLTISLGTIQVYTSIIEYNVTEKIIVIALFVWWVFLFFSWLLVDIADIRVIIYGFMALKYTWFLWRFQSKWNR